MALGYRGHAGWRDMSEYVVHFCRTREALIEIMASSEIEGRTPFGWARDFEQDREAARQRGEPLADYPTQKCVCLSEVPLDLLDRLIDRRGPWGLGFTKRSVMADDGGPVWYVEIDTRLAHALSRLRNSLTPDQQRAFFTLAPFIDKTGEFPDGSVYRFEWEREWRVPRRLDFGVKCPVFLFAPQAEHAQLTADLKALNVDATAHGIPPLLDPRWAEGRLQAALSQVGL